MESGTTLFTEISLLEQASLSGGVISIGSEGGAGGSAIAEPGETVVIGSPGSPGVSILGESILGESSTIFRSGERSKANKKRSKADKKRVKKARKRIKQFD